MWTFGGEGHLSAAVLQEGRSWALTKLWVFVFCCFLASFVDVTVGSNSLAVETIKNVLWSWSQYFWHGFLIAQL